MEEKYPSATIMPLLTASQLERYWSRVAIEENQSTSVEKIEGLTLNRILAIEEKLRDVQQEREVANFSQVWNHFYQVTCIK